MFQCCGVLFWCQRGKKTVISERINVQKKVLWNIFSSAEHCSVQRVSLRFTEIKALVAKLQGHFSFVAGSLRYFITFDICSINKLVDAYCSMRPCVLNPGKTSYCKNYSWNLFLQSVWMTTIIQGTDIQVCRRLTNTLIRMLTKLQVCFDKSFVLQFNATVYLKYTA